jgi:hypothetical protein
MAAVWARPRSVGRAVCRAGPRLGDRAVLPGNDSPEVDDIRPGLAELEVV